MSRHQQQQEPRKNRYAGRPTLIALLIGGLVLAGGIALVAVTADGGSSDGAGRQTHAAAMVTSPAHRSAATTSPAVTSAPATSAAPTTSAPAPAASSSPKPAAKTKAKAKPVVYTVKRGDNLTVIARWFHVHGGVIPLYKWNKSVVGRNPNLIFAGPKVIVAPNGKISVGH